jgi:hypothetical protein
VALDDKRIADIVVEIRRALNEADTAADNWDVREAERDEIELVDYYVDRAFTQTLLLLELCGALKTFEAVNELYTQAKSNFRESAFSINASQVYLVWVSKLRNYIDVFWTSAGPTAPTESAVRRVQRVLQRLDTVRAQLRASYQKRKGLEVKDEHDLQHLLNALLRVEFDDVRREEFGPSHAGLSARVDFLITDHRVVVEAKMTRPGLGDKRIGEQLTIDLASYQKRPDCNAVIFFIYDPDRYLKNPAGLRKDLIGAAKNIRLFVEIAP